MSISAEQFAIAKEKVKDLVRSNPGLRAASPRVGRAWLPEGGECIKVTLASRLDEMPLIPAEVDGVPVVLEIAGEAIKFAE
jgi:hypothetical protein